MIFTPDVAYIDGKLLAHAQNIKVNLETPDTDVETIPLGYCGKSPGPRKIMATIDGVNPTHPDYNTWKAALQCSEVEMRFVQTMSGFDLKSTGYLQAPSRDSGVGKAGTNTIEFHGKPSDWSGE